MEMDGGLMKVRLKERERSAAFRHMAERTLEVALPGRKRDVSRHQYQRCVNATMLALAT